MTNINKIISKFKNNSKNITFSETERVLKCVGYLKDNKGKTSGSRIRFFKSSSENLLLHRPHPRNTLLSYQVKEVSEILKKEGLL